MLESMLGTAPLQINSTNLGQVASEATMHAHAGNRGSFGDTWTAEAIVHAHETNSGSLLGFFVVHGQLAYYAMSGSQDE
jgi:hypothetical protein